MKSCIPRSQSDLSDRSEHDETVRTASQEIETHGVTKQRKNRGTFGPPPIGVRLQGYRRQRSAGSYQVDYSLSPAGSREIAQKIIKLRAE
jgi:hypothetical protein